MAEFSVGFGGIIAPVCPVLHVMPQDSVLGPLLFILYTSEISRIAHERGHRYECYADDTQLYFHIKPNESTFANCILESCLSNIRERLAINRLLLIPDKTELMWSSSARRAGSFMPPSISVDGSVIRVTDSVRERRHI